MRKGRLLFVLFIVIASCNEFDKNESHQHVSDAQIARGQLYARKYCQSCHLLPDPSQLDSKSWERGVLPQMGPRLGIIAYGNDLYPSSRNDRNLDQSYYPSTPVLKYQEWQNIIDYYTAVSPESLPPQKRKYEVKANPRLFKPEIARFKVEDPAVCFLRIDTSVSPRQLIVAESNNMNIFRFDNQFSMIDSFQGPSPVVDMEIHSHDLLTCNVGVMNPNNGKFGLAQKIRLDDQHKMETDSSFKIEKLARPVEIISVDLNTDKKTDYLVCEFGNLVGALSWMEDTGEGKFEKHVLRSAPGPIKAYIRDVNNDGLPDIWALFTQGEEGIFLFTNKGKGQFAEEQILRFQPVFGSSYFEMNDFNQDGFPDILYTCGDNADFSPVLKPYHGVYIFLNDGKNHFKQKSFFAMYGCFKAMARDFDGDGDLDIAAISFFADNEKHPEESFLYLENKGDFDFQPYTIPGMASGRWLTMDAGDWDNDGKPDLFLGNFSITPENAPVHADWKNGPFFLFLKNITKK